jgi:uncharacterized protein
MLQSTALIAISFYQRYLSPYKGFCCAYRVYTHRASCSALGYKAIQQKGLFTGLGILQMRFERCKAALTALRAQHSEHQSKNWPTLKQFSNGNSLSSAKRSQAGDCDPGIADCCTTIELDGKLLRGCDSVPLDCCSWEGSSDKKKRARKNNHQLN